MDEFHKELHIPVILFSGLRVPCCKETMIKSTFAIVFYELYKIFTDLIIICSLISIGWGAFMPGQTMIDRIICGIGVMATVVSFVKIVYCILFTNDFKRIFKLWSNDYFNDDPYINDLLQTVNEQKIRMRNMIFLVFCLITPPAVVWGLLPYLPIMQKLHGGKFTVLPVWFPFDIHTSPNFELAVLFQTFGALYVTAKNVAFDSISYNLISRQTAQLKHLRATLRNIMSVVDINNKGQLSLKSYNSKPTDNDVIQVNMSNVKNHCELERRLRIWAKHHQYTIKIGLELNKLYSVPFVLLMLHEVSTICLVGFTILASNIDYFQIASLTGYAFGNLLMFFLVCWLGDLLTYQSKHLLELGFSTNWYACSKLVRNSLKIIYQRCLTPFKLLGLGVYPVSSETFVSIIMSAYSYIMVLKQLKTKGHIY